MHEADLGSCINDDVGIDPGIPGLECWGLAEVIQTALITEGCGIMTTVQANTLKVTKSDIKFSKKGDRAKVDFKVEGEYVNTKGSTNKDKKVNLTIKGKNYDRVLSN